MIKFTARIRKFTIKQKCIVCGKKFLVDIRSNDNKILTKCFYSRMHKNVFLNWTYKLYMKTMKIKNIHFKNKFWKIIAYTSLQREIIYFIWNIIFGWQKIEYWECTKCSKT